MPTELPPDDDLKIIPAFAVDAYPEDSLPSMNPLAKADEDFSDLQPWQITDFSVIPLASIMVHAPGFYARMESEEEGAKPEGFRDYLNSQGFVVDRAILALTHKIAKGRWQEKGDGKSAIVLTIGQADAISNFLEVEIFSNTDPVVQAAECVVLDSNGRPIGEYECPIYYIDGLANKPESTVYLTSSAATELNKIHVEGVWTLAILSIITSEANTDFSLRQDDDDDEE